MEYSFDCFKSLKQTKTAATPINGKTRYVLYLAVVDLDLF